MNEIKEPVDVILEENEKTVSEFTKEVYDKYKGIVNIISSVIIIGIIGMVGYNYFNTKKLEAVNEKVGSFYSAYYSGSEDIYNVGEDIAATLKGAKGTASVLFLLANKYEESSKLAEATKLYETIVNNYDKKMEIVSFSYSKLAFILEATDLKKSGSIFSDMIKSYPKSPLLNVWKLELARINKTTNVELSTKLCNEIIDTEKTNGNIRQQAKNLLTEINM